MAMQAHAAPASERPRSQLSVQIVPTSSDAKTWSLAQPSDDGAQHFHVVLTNASNGPIRLWKEWCSWGYFNLSFESRDSKGKAVVISKKIRDWDKNFPCPVELAAGEHWVIDVGLEPAIWHNSPLSDDSGKATIRLKAVYEIREDKASKEEKVWTGRRVLARGGVHGLLDERSSEADTSATPKPEAVSPVQQVSLCGARGR